MILTLTCPYCDIVVTAMTDPWEEVEYRKIMATDMSDHVSEQHNIQVDRNWQDEIKVE